MQDISGFAQFNILLDGSLVKSYVLFPASAGPCLYWTEPSVDSYDRTRDVLRDVLVDVPASLPCIREVSGVSSVIVVRKAHPKYSQL